MSTAWTGTRWQDTKLVAFGDHTPRTLFEFEFAREVHGKTVTSIGYPVAPARGVVLRIFDPKGAPLDDADAIGPGKYRMALVAGKGPPLMEGEHTHVSYNLAVA